VIHKTHANLRDAVTLLCTYWTKKEKKRKKEKNWGPGCEKFNSRYETLNRKTINERLIQSLV